MTRLFAVCRGVLFVVVCALGARAAAQGTVPAVLMSDVHFDPFHNPHVFQQLVAAPIQRWPAILNGKPDLLADADRAAMQVECHARGVDTWWPLFENSLAAARDAEPHPVFVTLSGDLLVHEFPCRFRHLDRGASAQDLSAFAAKTEAFVVMELRHTFPQSPVYVAVGNNDSGCADYHESAGSPFLQSFAADVRRAVAAGARGGLRGHGKLEISPQGDYSVDLPAPIQRGRLIVIDDVFESRDFGSCGGSNGTAQADQIAWLRAQLSRARAERRQVWVMGHIPPGIDAFASFSKYVLRPGDLCSASPRPFLDGTALPDTLLDFADVIRLVVFGHTHMDEIRLLRREGGGGTGAAAIAVKLVPSVTPFAGNHPAFMVAAIDPKTLVLKDWATYVSPEPNGSAAPWPVAYRFSTAYHLAEFSAATVQQLADGFAADRGGRDAKSSVYRQHFFAGDAGLYALGLDQIWPAYACTVREYRTDAFHECLCPSR